MKDMGNQHSNEYSPGTRKVLFFLPHLQEDSKKFMEMCSNMMSGTMEISEQEEMRYLFDQLEAAQIQLMDYKTQLIEELKKTGSYIKENVITYKQSQAAGPSQLTRQEHPPYSNPGAPFRYIPTSDQGKAAGPSLLTRQEHLPYRYTGAPFRYTPEDQVVLFTTENMKAQKTHIGNEIEKLKEANEALKKERTSLLIRLSKVAGENNPAIADLSDRNRPTKLAEFYSELYDNEWTDAFEKLKDSGYTDVECIYTLRMTLKNAFDFCKKKSDLLGQKTSDAVNILFEEYRECRRGSSTHRQFTIRRKKKSKSRAGHIFPGEDSDEAYELPLMWRPRIQGAEKLSGTDLASTIRPGQMFEKDLEDKLIKFRKEIAQSLVPALQKAYLRASWSPECIPALKPYIKQCLFIGWMMVVQSPPLCFSQDLEPGAPVDTNLYKFYTTSGQTIDYLVWPAMLLHDKGPLLAKGVAQAQKGR